MHNGCKLISHQIMRRLPPLRAFQSFEAAASHESFSRAASTLCVTHSAISHQIRSLENWLGKELFVRHNSGVRLTADGEQLKSACMAAFSRLEDECARIRTPVLDRKLTIACSASFLAHWLLPRIERFSRQLPALVLNFQTSGDVDALLSHRVDALIISGQAPLSADIEATCLAADTIGPVCAPNWPHPPRGPLDIRELPLFHATSRLNAWNEWAEMVGVAADLRQGQTLDSLSLTIEAARSGLGFAITPELLVRRDLEEGRLIAPLGFVQVERATFLYLSASRKGQPDIAAFRHWLVSEAESDSPPLI
jgi:LysR family transcriptional regulator, glycine cleavage system transcriptional activator